MRIWRGDGDRMTKRREIHSATFPHSLCTLLPPSLSISYIKTCQILSKNYKYGIFVANFTKELTYAL